jgi:two-component system response regulator FlrC
MAVSVSAEPAAQSMPLNPMATFDDFMSAAKSNLGLQEPVMADEADSLPTDLHSAARMNEHQVIMATLASTPSKTEAAKRLGISPRTLRYKLAQLREHGLGMASAAY